MAGNAILIRARAWMLAVACVVLVVACGASPGTEGDDGSQADAEPIHVRFMQPIPESMAFYPYFVADEMGFFEEENLNVELLPSGDTETTLQLASGNIDIGAINGPEILVAISGGEDWVVFYDYYQQNVFSIVVPDNSDVTSIEDLSGRTIGITSEGGGELPLVKAALSNAGIDEADVEFLAIGDGGPAAAQAIKDGRVDVYAAAIQDLVAIQVDGVEFEDITPDEFAFIPANSFAMQRSVYETPEGQEMAQRFARAWAKGTHVGITDSNVVMQMAQERVPEETGDEEFADAFLERALFLQTPPGETYGELLPDRWQRVQEIMMIGGELEETIDPSSFLDDAGLEYANDWDRAEVEASAAEMADGP